MKYILSAIAFLFGGLLLFNKQQTCTSVNNSNSEDNDKVNESTKERRSIKHGYLRSNKSEQIIPGDTVLKGPYSKKELEAMLYQLSKSKKPTELDPGAMCYSVAMSPDSIPYVCPVCGEKTIYTNGLNNFVFYELPQCRRMAVSLKEHGIILDETMYCSHCRKSDENISLCIYVYSQEGELAHNCNVDEFDLSLLLAFFSGEKIVEGGYGNEIAIKDHIDKIRYLLGLSND